MPVLRCAVLTIVLNHLLFLTAAITVPVYHVPSSGQLQLTETSYRAPPHICAPVIRDLLMVSLLPEKCIFYNSITVRACTRCIMSNSDRKQATQPWATLVRSLSPCLARPLSALSSAVEVHRHGKLFQLGDCRMTYT